MVPIASPKADRKAVSRAGQLEVPFIFLAEAPPALPTEPIGVGADVAFGVSALLAIHVEVIVIEDLVAAHQGGKTFPLEAVCINVQL